MDWWKKLRTFLKEVRAEMQKVSFPSREEVISTSIVVVVSSFIFGIFLWASDLVIQFLYQGIFEALG